MRSKAFLSLTADVEPTQLVLAPFACSKLSITFITLPLMVESFQLLLLILIVAMSFLGPRFTETSRLVIWIQRIATKPRSVIVAIGLGTLLGCLAIAVILHEPVPRIHDEFSYVLLSDTLAAGRLANPSPPLPEFFDTFHVLMRPVYASKYFLAQGVFLAIGQKLTGHPAVGVWLSSALACVAMYWMLRAWIAPIWAMAGGFLFMVQFGIFSYWSQSYWGGMAAALGGALFFGAFRRLWESFAWQNAVWLGLSLIILINSRPLEGAFAALPAITLLLLHVSREQQWKQPTFWTQVVIPAGVVLVLGAAATGAYNHAITGSFWKPPYVLHEQQYQESPQLTFLPLHPKITYSSPWVQYYYEVYEMRLYLSQRTPRNLIITTLAKLLEWWKFYCGILLSVPLVLPALLRGGKTRYWQLGLLIGFIIVVASYNHTSVGLRVFFDSLVLAQIVVLWFVFDTLWSRLAIATCAILLVESLFVKWARPHYFAPAAGLVLFLQMEGLRKIWHWLPVNESAREKLKRSERRQALRNAQVSKPLTPRWRSLVIFLPVACVVSLVLRVEATLNDWKDNSYAPYAKVLTANDWSLRRAELEHWLEQQPGPQLVFVRYSPRHHVNFEWVFNHADLVHSHVIWARDLGAEHNHLLLAQLRDRTVWSLEADHSEPQLVPYTESTVPVEAPSFEINANEEEDKLNR
jgi:hypothetical protein